MALRGLWICHTDGEVLLSRRYPTVERRVRRQLGAAYSAIPSDADMGDLIHSLPLRGTQPVVSVADRWPLVVLRRGPHVFAAAVACEDAAAYGDAGAALSHVEGAALTDALTLLDALASTGTVSAELVNFMAPFGRAADLSTGTARLLLRQGFPATDAGGDGKRPGWKPHSLYRGKGRMDLMVQEEVRAVLYDSETVADHRDVTGVVLCKADLEGLPDVTVTLGAPAALASVIVHPCVQPPETGASTRLCFSPVTGPFRLCRYTLREQPDTLPLRGFYQLKDLTPTSSRMLLQLKLDAQASNLFEYCDVLASFPNRGPIAHIDANPSIGVVTSRDRTSFVWTVGTRFPGKALEVVLPAVIHFGPAGPDTADDPFLTGQTHFVQVSFKMIRSGWSGVTINPKAVVVYPSARPQVTVDYETVGTVQIWNSLGKVRRA